MRQYQVSHVHVKPLSARLLLKFITDFYISHGFSVGFKEVETIYWP